MDYFSKSCVRTQVLIEKSMMIFPLFHNKMMMKCANNRHWADRFKTKTYHSYDSHTICLLSHTIFLSILMASLSIHQRFCHKGSAFRQFCFPRWPFHEAGAVPAKGQYPFREQHFFLGYHLCSSIYPLSIHLQQICNIYFQHMFSSFLFSNHAFPLHQSRPSCPWICSVPAGLRLLMTAFPLLHVLLQGRRQHGRRRQRQKFWV